MAWDCVGFLEELQAAVDGYDRQKAEALCDRFVEHLKTSGQNCPVGESRSILQALRKKRLFPLMEQVGDAMVNAGEADLGVRADYVQALIDGGKLYSARMQLEAIIKDAKKPGVKPGQRAKAFGQLGRVHKQDYVSRRGAVSEEAGATLRESALAYQNASAIDPGDLWYPINVIALAARAEHDGIKIDGLPDARKSAEEIRDRLIDRDIANLSVWDLATGLEACVAVRDPVNAREFMREYLARKDTDAFEVSSTYRQMVEVWQLDDASEPGASVLPVLRRAVMSRKGAYLELLPAHMRTQLGPSAEASFERVFGKDLPRLLSWYQLMLACARSVGRISSRIESQRGSGTGLLVPAVEFAPHRASEFADGELLLLTNSHVVSQKESNVLRPRDAVVVFEALDEATTEVAVGEVLWESPRDQLDAALLRLKQPVRPKIPLPSLELAPRDEPPQYNVGETHRRVFVIGHALGGPLAISLQDSLQVGWNEPRLHYRTPTEQGSSGSPVFDENWRLLALHHVSSENFARGAETYAANEGIWIHAIRGETLKP